MLHLNNVKLFAVIFNTEFKLTKLLKNSFFVMSPTSVRYSKSGKKPEVITNNDNTGYIRIQKLLIILFLTYPFHNRLL